MAAAGLVCILAATACGKDKYTTKPQLKFKKAGSYSVAKGGLLELYLEFTDQEGDISDTLFIQNATPGCPASNFPQPLPYKIPDIVPYAKLKGELLVTFENGTTNLQIPIYQGPQCGRPDTTTFRFWMKDKAGNVSDTVSTDKPLIIF